MKLDRRFGILLHPTSFPGRWGIGVLGKHARSFIDWLHEAGASYWQVLPLGPTGYGDSPYSAVCSFAGNPYLIDPDQLVSSNWLDELEPAHYPDEWVDYGGQYAWKWRTLQRAYAGFQKKAGDAERALFAQYRKQEAYWIEDYAMYRALKKAHHQRSWDRWPDEIKKRQPAALDHIRTKWKEEIDFHSWTQWVFDQHWQAIRQYAKERGVAIIGDIPIFVAQDSPEVWAHPELFHLDLNGSPTVVAGVPPDYFSDTGQLWGNPLYRWQEKKSELFSWWIERIKTVLHNCDLIRIDHFRGFCDYWEIKATATTAVEGRWVEGPGDELFFAMERQLGQVPIIAEDLGIITPEVEALRDKLNLPGMKVLQFAFDGNPENEFLPHHHPQHGHCLVYTGTHDNETSLGWYHNLCPERQQDVQDYLSQNNLATQPGDRFGWSLIQLAFSSPAKLALIPLQDVLGLGNEARMNTPAVAKGNWTWRYRAEALSSNLAQQLLQIAKESGRER